MNIKTKILLLLGLALGASACHKNGANGIIEQDETCSVSLALRSDYTVDEVVLTRSVECPADGDFDVRIENTRAEVLRTWKYEELPNMIKVVPGSYKLVACYGSDTLLPAFDTPYYYGETKVTLKDGDNLDTIVKTAVGAVKVALTFDESFDFDYDDYFVEVKTVGDSLHFAKDEEREGYFLPGDLRMRFGLRPRGQEAYYEFYPQAIKAVKASEFYRMTLKALSENGALSKISIVTDSTTLDIPVDVELPTFFLPKAAPKVTFQADTTEDGRLVALEGEKKDAIVLISSAGGLIELKIKVDGAAQSQGWPAEIDLMNAEEAVLNALKAKGISWDEKITAGGVVKSLVWVRFDDAISQLTAPSLQMECSGLSICATDRFGQVSESRIDLETHPVLFAEEPTEADIWAKRAEMKVKTGGVEETYIEYKSPESDWQRATLEEISRGTDRADYWVKNLDPNQEYVFRACVGDYKSIQEFTFVTEEAAQVPNSGFEEYYSEKVWEKTPMGGQKIYAFYPYLESTEEENRWWNTRNRVTTQSLGDYSWYYAAYPGTVPTCESSLTASDYLNRYNGKSLKTEAHTGNIAMEIATIGWGKNNWTSQSSAQKNCQYRTAGTLYIGTFDLSNYQEEYGHKFASRPSEIRFFYKFYSYQSETTKAYALLRDNNGDEIGYGELRITDATDDWQNGVLRLHYSQMKKAASITIVFLSTDSLEPETLAIKGGNSVFSGYGDSRHIGSILTVDDIELIYE